MFVGARVGLVWVTCGCAKMGINRDFYERGIGLEIADMNKPGSKATIVHLRAQVCGPSNALLAAQSSLAFVRGLG